MWRLPIEAACTLTSRTRCNRHQRLLRAWDGCLVERMQLTSAHAIVHGAGSAGASHQHAFHLINSIDRSCAIITRMLEVQMLILMLRFLAARPMVSGLCTPPTLLLSLSAYARFIWRFFEAASCHARCGTCTCNMAHCSSCAWHHLGQGAAPKLAVPLVYDGTPGHNARDSAATTPLCRSCCRRARSAGSPEGESQAKIQEWAAEGRWQHTE